MIDRCFEIVLGGNWGVAISWSKIPRLLGEVTAGKVESDLNLELAVREVEPQALLNTLAFNKA